MENNSCTKSILLVMSILLMFNIRFTEAQTIKWCSNNDCAIQNMCMTDKDYRMVIYKDNMYIVGNYCSGTTVFNTGAYSFTGQGGLFIAKYDLNGVVQWVKHAGSTTNRIVLQGISADAVGNISIVGWFRGTVTFGTNNLVSKNTFSNTFIANFNSNGNINWSKGILSKGGSGLSCIAVNEFGDICVSATFSDSLFIDTVKIYSQGIVLAKFNSTGNLKWLNIIGGSVSPFSLCIDNDNNIYLGGSFSTNFTTPKGTMNTTGLSDIVILKYKNNGDIVWQKKYGGTNDDYLYVLRSDGKNLFMGGYFYLNSVIGNTSLTSVQDDDMFTSKLDTAGTEIWTNEIAGYSTFCGYPNDILIDQYGNSYFTGNYFGDAKFGNITLTASGSGYYTFLVKYNSNGVASFAKGPFGSYGSGVVLDYAQNIYVLSRKVTTSSEEYFSLCKYSNNNPNCIAHYTTTYDSIQNAFTTDIDTLTTALAVSYHWDFGDGTSSTLATPSHIYLSDTLYNLCLQITTATGVSCSYCHVIGKDANGQIVRSGGFVLNIHDITTGMNQNISEEPKIVISPNPTSGIFNVQINKFKNAKLKIYNVYGECIYQYQSSSASFKIDLSDEINGIYFMNIKTEEGVITKKIILNK